MRLSGVGVFSGALADALREVDGEALRPAALQGGTSCADPADGIHWQAPVVRGVRGICQVLREMGVECSRGSVGAWLASGRIVGAWRGEGGGWCVTRVALAEFALGEVGRRDGA